MENNTQINERNVIAQRQDADDDEIDLLKLWQTIWHRKWSIMTLVLVVTMVTIQVVPVIVGTAGWRWAFPLLALGPVLGVAAIRRFQRVTRPAGFAMPVA